MKSQQITSGRYEKTSTGWIHGVNSVRNPWYLPEDQFKWGVNVTCRGGLVQTRPGFSMRLSLPKGNFQGGIIFNANKQAQSSATVKTISGTTYQQKATIFLPDGSAVEAPEASYAMFCVDGSVYYAPFPLKQPKNWTQYKLTGISLDPNTPRVNFCIATQSATIKTGTSVNVTPSHRLLIIQDGINQPAYWDGSDKIGAHSPDMPIGYWMAYSGNRLWVANGNIISASDLANPLGWTERTQGTGRGDFSVPRPVTAIQDYVGQNNDTRLFVFTDRSTYTLASGILDRAQWAATANFQQTVFPTIGCVAGNSIAFQAGQMWWYAQGGLVAIDVAAASYLSSQVLYKDIEMAKAKRLMAPDNTGICATSFENYLLYSIPYLEPLNSATMVLDYAAASEWNQQRSPAWCGVWTGIRPVSWSSGVINNQSRAFAFSVDYASTSDGSYNHLWEAFTENRFDTYLQINQDGSTSDLISRIYCQMESGMLGDKMDLKQFVYSEIDCSQISGTVDVKVSFRGSKGQYQPILSTRLLAATAPYQYENNIASSKISELGLLQTQYRRLISENSNRKTSYTSCESNLTLDVDKAFSLLIEWCGSLGVEALRMFSDPWQTISGGTVTAPEQDFCVVGEDGASLSVALPASPVETPNMEKTSFSSTQTRTVTVRCPGNSKPAVSATATASFISYVSQQDAVDQAAAIATQQATITANQYRVAHPC